MTAASKCLSWGSKWEQVVINGSCFGFELAEFSPKRCKGLFVVFTGTFQRALDGKLRVLLPKRLRSSLPANSNLFLTPGTDHCLELHTDKSLTELALRANQSSASSRNVRSFSRLFYARAEQCDIDNQGRIRIPSHLAELADLQKELVFIGVGFHWELWNLKLWESYLQQNDSAFDQLSDSTFGPPVGGIEPVVDVTHFSHEESVNKVSPK